jgi:hypothetical protein
MHVIEPAASGRAKCRGCGKAIAKGELRFGERLPNPYGDGEMTLWFHLTCGAYKRPETFLEVLESTEATIEDKEALESKARFGLAHRRLPRLDKTEQAPTGRARCRSCKEAIAKKTWRISLVYYEEGRFEPSGFIHTGCAKEYFETTDIMDRVRHFSLGLEPAALQSIEESLEA